MLELCNVIPEVWLSCKSLSQTKAGAQVQGYLRLSSWSSKSHLDPRREFQAAHSSTRQWLHCSHRKELQGEAGCGVSRPLGFPWLLQRRFPGAMMLLSTCNLGFAVHKLHRTDKVESYR